MPASSCGAAAWDAFIFNGLRERRCLMAGLEQFDVVIVGARCAGSPLAAMLAGRGLSVCVVDKARFPSDTLSTHMIQPGGVRTLHQLGVFERLMVEGAVPLDRLTMVTDHVRLEAASIEALFGLPVLCLRRVTLDALLVEAAIAAGAQVRTGSRVTGLLNDAGRVTGVQTDHGTIRARLVVGADGRHSTVASLLDAPKYHVTPPGRLCAWAYYEGATNQEGHVRMGRMDHMGYLAGPTDGDLHMVALGVDLGRQREFDADRDGYFTTALRQWPELADAIGSGRRVGPIRVVSKWHGYFRQSAGPGWVLVGDAGHFKDFVVGQGISDALRQAEHLSHAIGKALDGTDVDAAMQSWWRWRDDDAYEMYWLSAQLGRPGATSSLTHRLLQDISADAGATRAFLSVLTHDLRPSQMLTPTRLARAVAGTIRDEPEHVAATLKEALSYAKSSVLQTWHKRSAGPRRQRGDRRQAFDIGSPSTTRATLDQLANLK